MKVFFQNRMLFKSTHQFTFIYDINMKAGMLKVDLKDIFFAILSFGILGKTFDFY